MTDNEIIDGNPFGENVADQSVGNVADPQPEVEQPPIDPLPEPEIDGDLYMLSMYDTAAGYSSGDPIRLDLVRQFLIDRGYPPKAVSPGENDGEVLILNPSGAPQITEGPDWALYDGTNSVTTYGQTVTGDAATVTPELAATAYGNEAAATGEASTAVGRNAEAAGSKSTAVGDHAVAFGPSTVAMGTDTRAGGQFGTAIGQEARAWGDYSTALGYQAVVGAEFGGAMSDFNGTAVGAQAQATQERATAIGHLAVASHIASTALGYAAEATQLETIALGASASAVSQYAIAIGSEAQASYPQAVAIGRQAVSTRIGSLAIGNGAQATSLAAVALGYGSYATATYATALGGGASAGGQYSLAVGTSAQAPYSYNIAIGMFAQVTSPGGSDTYDAIVIGGQSTVSAIGAIAIGRSLEVTEPRRAAIKANDLEVVPQNQYETSIIIRDTTGAKWRISVNTSGAIVVTAA